MPSFQLGLPDEIAASLRFGLAKLRASGGALSECRLVVLGVLDLPPKEYVTL